MDKLIPRCLLGVVCLGLVLLVITTLSVIAGLDVLAVDSLLVLLALLIGDAIAAVIYLIASL